LKLPEPGLGRIADAAVPAQVLAVLTDLIAALPILLDENLVGIYLYGSLTQGAFNTERSDVDCIV
jgi:hypothetical protein